MADKILVFDGTFTKISFHQSYRDNSTCGGWDDNAMKEGL